MCKTLNNGERGAKGKKRDKRIEKGGEMGVSVGEKKACNFEIVCCQRKMFASFVLNILFCLEKTEKKKMPIRIFCFESFNTNMLKRRKDEKKTEGKKHCSNKILKR